MEIILKMANWPDSRNGILEDLRLAENEQKKRDKIRPFGQLLPWVIG